MPSDTELIGRAIAAWVKYASSSSGDPPTWRSSTVEEYDELLYVILRDSSGAIVDVYRYRERYDSLSRMLRYWPGPYGRQRVAAYA